MDKIKIISGNPLFGKVFISGAKNTALPIICASLLTDEPVTLRNLPILSDITSLNLLLQQIGTQIEGKQEDYPDFYLLYSKADQPRCAL